MEINTNIRPFIESAILISEKIQNEMNAKLSESSRVFYIPKRTVLSSGALKSDQEYLSHFRINSTNIGFEAPGVSSISVDILQYKLEGK